MHNLAVIWEMGEIIFPCRSVPARPRKEGCQLLGERPAQSNEHGPRPRKHHLRGKIERRELVLVWRREARGSLQPCKSCCKVGGNQLCLRAAGGQDQDS